VVPRRIRARVFGPPGGLVSDQLTLVTSAEADVSLLDLRGFDDLDALFAQRGSLDGPALLRVDPAVVSEALSRLGPGDDLCVYDDPVPLVAHRLLALAGPRDGLTGLATRATWTRELERSLASASEERPVSIVMIDIDHFKGVNDTLGHGGGDAVLTALGDLLLQRFSAEPLVARVGGEEMGILVAGDEARATEVGEQARAAVEAAPLAEVAITVSAGAATADEPIALGELVREANQALYAAKAGGRNRVVHATALARKNAEAGKDDDLAGFEDFTRVIAERVAEVITRRGRRLFHELKEQADVDALTQLFSRRYLDRRLPFEAEQAEAGSVPLTVALLDIDHFGDVNKTHGWPTGDRVLSELAEVVRGTIRGSDWVARYGGEEICVVLTNTALDEAEPVLERIRTAVEGHEIEGTQGQRVKVTVSIGAAERNTKEEVEALVERASDKLLAAKRSGRNTVRV
jgi:diguanylate cyclase (GGDEF)-like protein